MRKCKKVTVGSNDFVYLGSGLVVIALHQGIEGDGDSGWLQTLLPLPMDRVPDSPNPIASGMTLASAPCAQLSMAV